MNSPHGEPVEVSELTDDAESTIVRPSNERQTTSPASTTNGVARGAAVVDADVFDRGAFLGRTRGFGAGLCVALGVRFAEGRGLWADLDRVEALAPLTVSVMWATPQL